MRGVGHCARCRTSVTLPHVCAPPKVVDPILLDRAQAVINAWADTQEGDKRVRGAVANLAAALTSDTPPLAVASEAPAWSDEATFPLFLDAKGYVWRDNGDGSISMARTNPDNSVTPEPWRYLVPQEQVAALREAGLRVVRNLVWPCMSCEAKLMHDDECEIGQLAAALASTDTPHITEHEGPPVDP